MVVRVTPVLLSLTVLIFWAALCPADPRAKDALGDPLPEGAIARLGTERMRNLTGYSGARLHPDGKRLVVNLSGKYTLLDVATGQPAGAFASGGGRYLSAISAVGTRAAFTTNDGFVVVDPTADKIVFELKRPVTFDVMHLTADGKFLAVGGRADDKDKTKPLAVTVYDVDKQKEAASLSVVQNQTARLLLSADGKRGVTWGGHTEPAKPGVPPDPLKDMSRVLQFWDVGKQAELGRGRMPGPVVFGSVAISPAGDRVAASTGDGTVALFDVATGKRLKELLGRSRVGSSLTFSPDGKTLAAAAVDGAVQLWDVESGKSLGVAPAPLASEYMPILSIAFTGPVKAVAHARVGRAEVLWEVPSGQVVSPVGGHFDSVAGVAFTADDKQVVTTAHTGDILRWDTAGKRLGGVALTVPGAHHQPPMTTRVLLPPGGDLLVRSDRNSVCGTYDLATGGQRVALPVPFGQEPPVGFSADGKRMAIATFNSFDKTARGRLVVVDVPANTKTAEVEFGPGVVYAVVVTPDGKTAGLFRAVPDDKGGYRTAYTGVDLEAGKVLGDTEYKSYPSVYAAACPDNKTVLVNRTVLGDGTAGQGLVLLDVATGAKVKEFDGVKTYPTAPPVFSRDGKRMAVAGGQASVTEVTVFDWAGGKPTHTFKGHASTVSALAFSKGGRMLATGSHDSTVLLWDVSKEQ